MCDNTSMELSLLGLFRGYLEGLGGRHFHVRTLELFLPLLGTKIHLGVFLVAVRGEEGWILGGLDCPGEPHGSVYF